MVILCTIDLETREVSLPAGQVIASYDHNVDVIRFQAETIPGFSLDTSSIKIAAQGPNKARHDYAVDPSTVQIEEETGYITFDWPIPAGVTEMPIGTFKYGDKGQLIFAVCAEIISGSTLSKAWHSDDGIVTVVAHLEPESGGGEDPEEEATNRQKIAQLQTATAILQREISGIASGTPPTASTIAGMDAETSTVYIYTGSEQGESTGYWYYYNGTTFVPGGQYGGATTSTTFDKHGVPADDFAVGEALAEKADTDDVTALDTRVTSAIETKADASDIDALDTRVTAVEGDIGETNERLDEQGEDIIELQNGGYVADQQQISQKINTWLNDHPEATTTVQDGSLTLIKFKDGELPFNTPEMFGAVGDGTTDDSVALQNCIDDAYAKNAIVYLTKVYATSKPIKVYGRRGIVDEQNTTYICGTGRGDSGIKKISTNVLSGSYTGNAVLVLVNASGIGSDTFEGNASGVRLEDFRVDANGMADYGIDMPYSTASCAFRRLFINRALVAGLHCGTDNYLNLYEQVFIYNSTNYAFLFDQGVNTSDNFLNCYAVTAQVAYKIKGIYMQMTNCCADDVYNTVFDLTGFRGALTAPGSEASMAKCMFKAGSSSRVTIVNPYTFGNFDDADAVHCDVGAGGVVDIQGGRILIDGTGNNRTAPGKLYETAYQAEIYFNGTATGKYAVNSTYIGASAYGKVANTYGSVNTRNGNKLAFLGIGGANDAGGYGDFKAETPNLDVSAVYMGFGESASTLRNGHSMSETSFKGGGTMAGDILLSKTPETIGGIGWAAGKDAPTNWTANTYHKIPILQQGGTADYPTTVVNGQRFYDTDKGLPMVYANNKWQVDTYGLQRFNVNKTNGTMTITRASGVYTFALITIVNSTKTIMALAYFYNSGVKITEIVDTGLTGGIDSDDNSVYHFTFPTGSRYVSVVTLYGQIVSVV